MSSSRSVKDRVNRTKLESDLLRFRRQIEKNNDLLIDLYSDFSSMVLWVLFYKAFFSDRGLSFIHKHFNFYSAVKDHEIEIISNFENELSVAAHGMSQYTLQQFVNIYQRDYPGYGIRVISDVLTMPFRLMDLPLFNGATSSKHLMYVVANAVDHLERPNDIEVYSSYSNILSLIIARLPSHLLKSLSEFRGALLPEKMSCVRYAELIHLFYGVYLAELNKSLDLATNPEMRKRLEEQFFWASMGFALSFSVLAAPIFKKFVQGSLFHRIVNSNFLRFDPLIPLLPKDLKNFSSPSQYRLLEIENLQKEHRSLQKAVEQQKKLYIHKSNYLNLLLTLSFFLSCFYFFGNSAFADTVFTFIPFLATLSLKQIYDLGSRKIRNARDENKLQQLNDRLNAMLSTISPNYDIQLEGNYLVLEIKGPYASLKTSQVSLVIKLVLHHYGVKLRLHDQTTLVIDADARIPVEEANQTFDKTLRRAQTHYQLAAQLRKLFHEQQYPALFNFEPIIFDKELNFGFNLLIGLISTNHVEQQLMAINGISVDSDNIILIRDTMLSSHEVGMLRKALSSIKKQVFDEEKSSRCSSSSASIQQKLKTKKTNAYTEGIETKRTPPEVKREEVPIHWDNGFTFPSPQIKRIENAPKRFILWDLPRTEFGDQEAYDTFKSHSTKIAFYGQNEQGIKEAPYLGENYHNGRRQELFPARVKVISSKYGMFGVLLSKQRSSSPAQEIIYRTCAYTRVH